MPLHPTGSQTIRRDEFSPIACCCRSQLQGQIAILESPLNQSQQMVSELQLQVASLQGEKQQLEQALQGAHAEIQTLHGVAG